MQPSPKPLRYMFFISAPLSPPSHAGKITPANYFKNIQCVDIWANFKQRRIKKKATFF